jgi:beta-phosphoglucomutase
MTQVVRALIFDVDGVLVQSMERNFEAYEKALEPLGLSISEDEVFANEGRRSRELIETVARDHGMTLTASQLDEATERHLAIFASFGRMPFYDGVPRLLPSLRNRGLRLAAVTANWRVNVERHFGELISLFEVIVTAEDVTRTKPDPEPYAAALAKLGLSSNDAVVIENAPLGILSAKAAGMWVVALTTTNPAGKLTKADLIVPGVIDVVPALETAGWSLPR